MFNKSFIVWLVNFLLALPFGNLSASVNRPTPFDEAIRDSALIFQGTVIKIESRIASDFGPNYEAEYYAFVTFRIERILKGEVEGDGTSFTLGFSSCFVGDFKKQPNMAIQSGEKSFCLDHYHTPTFEVGENNFLFVFENEHGVHLIRRFSVINNKIYPVAWLAKEGVIDKTPPYGYGTTREIEAGIDFTAPYGLKEEQEAEKRGEKIPREAKKYHWAPPKGAKRVHSDDFVYAIERELRRLERIQFMTGKLAPNLPVKSADFNDPYYYSYAKWLHEEQQRRKAWFLKMHPNGIQQR